jgi:hypothetical protein
MKQRGEQAVGWAVVGALVAPPAVMSAYLALSRWPSRWFTAGSDWLFLALSVGVGVAFLARLPLPSVGRMALACMYVAVAGVALVLYSLYFVGFVFDDWL